MTTAPADDEDDSGKPMFINGLETASFVLGIFVIVFVFAALFTIARRIVKKFTA